MIASVPLPEGYDTRLFPDRSALINAQSQSATIKGPDGIERASIIVHFPHPYLDPIKQRLIQDGKREGTDEYYDALKIKGNEVTTAIAFKLAHEMQKYFTNDEKKQIFIIKKAPPKEERVGKILHVDVIGAKQTPVSLANATDEDLTPNKLIASFLFHVPLELTAKFCDFCRTFPPGVDDIAPGTTIDPQEVFHCGLNRTYKSVHTGGTPGR